MIALHGDKKLKGETSQNKQQHKEAEVSKRHHKKRLCGVGLVMVVRYELDAVTARKGDADIKCSLL